MSTANSGEQVLLVAVCPVEAQPQHALAVALLDVSDAQAREVRRRVQEQSAVGKQRAFTRHFSRSRASCSAGPCGGSASPDDISLAAASEWACRRRHATVSIGIPR